MTQQNGGQYSPDGKWWWDGSRWVPAPQQPGVPPGPPARRRRIWPWVVGAIGALFLVVVIAAAAAGGGQKTASTTPTPTHAAATSRPAAPASRDGSCSPQPCANDSYGWIVTVSNIRYGASGGQFEQPEAGNVFVELDVTFTNRLDREQHANPTEFVLMDGAGIKHTWRPMTEGCGTWEPVNLTKGATLGPKCLSFEATGGKPTGLVLVWTPSGFGGGYSIKLS